MSQLLPEIGIYVATMVVLVSMAVAEVVLFDNLFFFSLYSILLA